jgi:hypothetical protein
MKALLLFFISFLFMSCSGQRAATGVFDFEKTMVIGRITDDGNSELMVDEARFLYELNERL